MENNVLKYRCQPHQQEIVAFDLDPLIEIKDRYLCMRCLTMPSQSRQIQFTEDAQQKFIEMTNKQFNNQMNQITSYLGRLLNAQKQIREFQEFFNNKISESMKILNQKISEVDNELKSLTEPSSQGMQTEQDLISLSNYVNFGLNLNQMNHKKYEFIDQIQQQLDDLKLGEHLWIISNTLESIFTQSLIKEQIKFFPSNQIDQIKQINLRYLCQKHKSEITMISLEPAQVEQRLFCYSIQEKKQDKLTSLFDVNQKWQVHQQNAYTSNNTFHIQRQNNQDKIVELIFQHQKYNQQLFNGLHKLIINQNNKIIKDRNNQLSALLNKQLFHMQLKEVELVASTLSQQELMQDVSQKQIQIFNEDIQFKDEILEQLDLQKNKLLRTSLEIDQLFCLKDFIKKLNEDQMEQLLLNQLFPQFHEKKKKFQNKYKQIICKVKSRLEKEQIENLNEQKSEKQIEQTNELKSEQQNQQKSEQNIEQKNNHKELQLQKCKKILEQIKQIEMFQLKQVNLSTQDLHIQLKLNIRFNQQFQINKLSDFSNINYNSWFIYRKNLKFSDTLKHQSININGNGKLATTLNNNYQIYPFCLFDQRIPQSGSFTVDFKINKLFYVMVGICESNIINKDYKFENYNQIGHGFYVLDNYGQTYSHHDSSKNANKIGFGFNTSDIINVEMNQLTKQIVWRNKANEQEYVLEFQSSDDLYFCCILRQYEDKKIDKNGNVKTTIKISEVEII